MEQLVTNQDEKTNKKNVTNLRILIPTREEIKKVASEINIQGIGFKTSNDDIILEALKLLKRNKKIMESLKFKNMSAKHEEDYTFKIYNEKYDPISEDDFKRQLRKPSSIASKLMKSLGFEV